MLWFAVIVATVQYLPIDYSFKENTCLMTEIKKNIFKEYLFLFDCQGSLPHLGRNILVSYNR